MFFAYHGVHEEEKILGGEYKVEVDLFLKDNENLISYLNETVDYTTVYTLVKQRMEQATPLLETVAMDLADTLKKSFPIIAEINIGIKKNNPPITSFTGNVEVTYRKQYL